MNNLTPEVYRQWLLSLPDDTRFLRHEPRACAVSKFYSYALGEDDVSVVPYYYYVNLNEFPYEGPYVEHQPWIHRLIEKMDSFDRPHTPKLALEALESVVSNG